MELEPIDTRTILTTTDPIPTSTLNVPGWIITETMEVTFGDYTGRPDVEHTQLAREMLAYFFQQGWYVVAVVSQGSGGEWTAVRTSQTSESSSADSSENVESTSTEESSSNGTNSFSSVSGGYNDGTNWNTSASGLSKSTSSGTSTANGTSGSVGSQSSTKTGTTTSGADGITDAYWSSWQKVRLQRKRVSPHKVLESMVGELIDSRNNGEKAIADRYTAVIALYSSMLSNSEKELGNLGDEVEDFKSLMNGVMTTVRETLASISVGGDDDKVNEAAEYQRKTINEKFDALIATKKGELITMGLFNSTQWTMIAAGIERERGVALLAVSDKILGWRRDLAATAASLAPVLSDAAKLIYGAGVDGILKPTQLRNEVLKWMLEYAERHNTERAKVTDVAQIPKILDGIAGGYAEKTF